MRLWIFPLALALALEGPAWAANKVSNASGRWADPSIWTPSGVPAASDVVTVAAGNVLSIDISTAIASTTTVNGTLSFSRAVSSTLTLVGGGLTVPPGGTLDLGTVASPIPAGVHATLVLASGAVAGQFGLLIQSGGNATVTGALKAPFVTAGQNISIGDTQIILSATAASLGWAPGDQIVVSPTTSNGATETERRGITAVSGNLITVSAPMAAFHGASATNAVWIDDLTRNAVIMSSGTNASANSAYVQSLAGSATSFSVIDGELAGLSSLEIDNAGFISSSSFHDGFGAVLIATAATGVTVSSNVLDAFDTNTAQTLAVSGNNNALVGNHLCVGNIGLYISGVGNVVASNRACSFSRGGKLEGASGNTVLGNAFFSNNYGLQVLGSSTNNLLVGNDVFLNSIGVRLNDAGGNLFINDAVHGNINEGVSWLAGDDVFAGGGLGFNSAGSPDSDFGEISGSASPGTLVLKSLKISEATFAGGVDPSALVQPGASVLAYGENSDAGSLRLWGDYTVPVGTMTLAFSAALYAPQATQPTIMSSASLTSLSVASPSTSAVTQLMNTVFRASDGLWHVVGSVSGDMGTLPAAGGIGSFPSSAPQFALSLSANAALTRDGERADFALIAGSGDSYARKKLLFGPSAATLNGGESKLTVPDTGGLSLSGSSAASGATLVDRLSANGAYYAIVDSGAFTLAYSTISNCDSSGVQLSGSAGVSIASSTFDNMGVVAGSTNAYITARSLTSNATFYNVTFNLSRSTAGAPLSYNVLVSPVDSSLNWTFASYSGVFGGLGFDDDPNNRLVWVDTIPPAGITTLGASSGPATGQATLTWLSPGDNGSSGWLARGRWRIAYSSDVATISQATTAQALVDVHPVFAQPGSTQVYVVTSLLPATSYYFRAWAADAAGNWSPLSNGATVQAGDLTLPQISWIAPATGSLGVATTGQIVVAFSKAMNPAALPAALQVTAIRDNLGNPISQPLSGTTSYSPVSFQLAFAAPFASNTAYLVTVTTAAQDIVGHPLTQAATAQFQTRLSRALTNVYTDAATGVTLTVPATALLSDGYVRASTQTISASLVTANNKLAANAGDGLHYPIAGSVVDLKAFDTAGQLQSAFATPITLSFPYSDLNKPGIIDGSNPPVRVDTLSVWWLDDANALWVRLPTSAVNTSSKRVTAQTGHFTTFALIGQAASDLSSAYAFPVPFRASQGNSTITFTNLGQNTRIRIFTVSGELVADRSSSSINGQYVWNVTNTAGQAVASGVYLYVLEDGGNRATGKLVIIR